MPDAVIVSIMRLWVMMNTKIGTIIITTATAAPTPARAIEPDPENYKAYVGGRKRYAALYQNTKEIMHGY